MLLGGLLLMSLILATTVGSDFIFTTVNGKPVTLYDSSALPDRVKFPVLLGLLLMTSIGLYRFRTVKRANERQHPVVQSENTWPPPPNTPVA